MKKILSLAALTVALNACSQIPQGAYFDRGSPYSLLDASSEVVNVALMGPDSVQEIVQWVDQDVPSQAEVYCLEDDAVCSQAIQTLEMFKVPVHYSAAADNVVVLVYDRVVARDCDNRYQDNPINPYNLNHKTFGCSTAVNMVQMVSDKRQFTSPNLLDFQEGDKAVQAYELYLQPRDSNQLSQSGSQGLQQAFQSK